MYFFITDCRTFFVHDVCITMALGNSQTQNNIKFTFHTSVGVTDCVARRTSWPQCAGNIPDICSTHSTPEMCESLLQLVAVNLRHIYSIFAANLPQLCGRGLVSGEETVLYVLGLHNNQPTSASNYWTSKTFNLSWNLYHFPITVLKLHDKLATHLKWYIWYMIYMALDGIIWKSNCNWI